MKLLFEHLGMSLLTKPNLIFWGKIMHVDTNIYFSIWPVKAKIWPYLNFHVLIQDLEIQSGMC